MRLTPPHHRAPTIIIRIKKDSATSVDAQVAAADGEDEGAHVVGEVDAVRAPTGFGHVVGFVDAVLGFVG